MQQWIDRLEKKLQEPLPGRKAQFRMAHAVRQQVPPPPPNARQAGVLALFYPRQHEWHIVLIQRVSHHQDRHSGQISFPGGKREEGDETLLQTALREAQEEVGVDAQKIRPLGGLTDLYIPVSNFQVHPFVGFTTTTPRFRPQAEEVAAVLEVPWNQLQDPRTINRKNLQLSTNIVLQNVPYFDIGGQTVWGATAMIISELIALTAQPENYGQRY